MRVLGSVALALFLATAVGCASPEPDAPTAPARSAMASTCMVPRTDLERALEAYCDQQAALAREWPEPELGPIIIKGGREPEVVYVSDDERAHREWVSELRQAAWRSQYEDNGGRLRPVTPEIAVASDDQETPPPAGPHIRTLANPVQKVGIYGGPGVQLLYLAEQGAPCEILASRLHAGTVWYLVRVQGTEGWTPLVVAY